MKKILGLVLLVILVIGMAPLAFAAKEDRQLKQTSEGDLVVEQAEQTQSQEGETLRARVLTKLNEAKLQRVNEYLRLMKAEAFQKFKEEGLKARERTEEVLREARERYKEAKKNIIELKKQHIEKKKNIINLRNELKKLEGEAYAEKEQEMKVAIKDFLADITETMEEHLEMVESKVEESEDLSEEEAAELEQEVEEAQEAVEEAQEAVETLDEDSTKEEIAEVAEKVKDAWENQVNPNSKNVANRLMNERMAGIVVRSKRLGVNLAKVLERAEKKGTDTSIVEGLVNDFNAKLEEAKEHYTEARNQFKERLVQEGQKNMKQAHDSLKEANVILKNIFKELKGKNLQGDLAEVEEEDLEGEAGEDELEESAGESEVEEPEE